MSLLGSFVDECLHIELDKEAGAKTEIAEAASKPASSVLKKLKWPAILGGGYVGGKQVEQAVKDYSLGKQVRKQYSGQEQ